METRIWADIFQLGVPLAEKVIRPIVIYIFLVLSLRLAGKRELSQLNPFDLIVLLTLSNTVQNAIIGEDNSVLGGMIGATTLLASNYWVVRFLHRHPRFGRLVEGEPSVLVADGKIRKKALDQESLTTAELEIAAHKQGFDTLEAVERAELDPGGGISFVRRSPSAEDLRYQEIMKVLADLKGDVTALRGSRSGPNPQTA